MKGRASRAAAVVIAGLLLASCGDGGDDDNTAPRTVPTAAGPTTTADPYAIPPVIDEAYVNRVLAGLDAIEGEIYRIVVATRDIPPEVIDRLQSIYLDIEDQNLQLQGIQHSLRENLDNFRANPGNPRSEVASLMSVSPTCVYARIERDFSDMRVAPGTNPNVLWIALKPRSAGGAARFNPTPWMISVHGVESHGPATDPCAGGA